jgi:hypothetical protein
MNVTRPSSSTLQGNHRDQLDTCSDASNEELKSTNEELQSTNEELETSREELQSVNEELMTMNTQYQARGYRPVPRELSQLERNITRGPDGKPIARKADVLEVMRDPRAVRSLKNAPPEVQEAFNNRRQAMYASHDQGLKDWIAKSTRSPLMKSRSTTSLNLPKTAPRSPQPGNRTSIISGSSSSTRIQETSTPGTAAPTAGKNFLAALGKSFSAWCRTRANAASRSTGSTVLTPNPFNLWKREVISTSLSVMKGITGSILISGEIPIFFSLLIFSVRSAGEGV